MSTEHYDAEAVKRDFEHWFKESGQFECALEDYGSPEEYRRILGIAYRAGRRAKQEHIEGLEKFVREIATQRVTKPDHWTPCRQCERNIDDAKELTALHPALGKGGK